MTPGENTKVSEGAVLSPDIPLLSIDRLTVQSGGIPLIDELELDVSAGSSVAIIDLGRGSNSIGDGICGCGPMIGLAFVAS